MENHEKPQHVSKDHENFIKEFIKVYKENILLWDKTHPKYNNRDARNAGLEILLNKCKEYYRDANIDFVKHKIDGMRGAFRREYRKVLESKKKAKTEDDIYIPSLWYYNLFLFTVGEECDDLHATEDNSYKNLYFWSKEHTVILIELLQKHPVLYCPDGSSNSTKGKRMKAYNQITKELITETGKNFKLAEVKRKILTLKQQFRRECRNKSLGQLNKHNKLWCYELLTFLKNVGTKKPEDNKDEKEFSDDSLDNVFIKDDDQHRNIDDKANLLLEENYDIFDTIGKNVAIKLRDMNDDQRKYAENLINQIMYNGLMENLNADSCISLNGF